MNSRSTLKLARNGYIVISLLFCLAGVWLISRPGSAARLVCLCVGILFIADGIIKIIGYFAKDFYCLAFQFDLAFGILMAAVGTIVLARMHIVQDLIFAIFGLTILADALFKIQICIDARRFGMDRLWWRLMLVAICTGVFGTILLIAPSQTLYFMTRVIGISFLAEGLLNLLIVIFMVKILEIQPRDGICS
ncbi:MAG: DUF308 domain-containing protein [Blautia sp.]|nr:DUF308 domain-containing protein [Blautia sp.]